jgi:DNA primase
VCDLRVSSPDRVNFPASERSGPFTKLDVVPTGSPKPGAPVSAPVTWNELAEVAPEADSKSTG